MSSTQLILLALVVLMGALIAYFVARKAVQKEVDAPLPPLRIDLGDAESPTISICPLDKIASQRLSPVTLDPSVLSRLSPLLQQAPGLAVSTATISGQLYKITFSPDVMNGLHEGSLALKKSLEGGFRAMVADGTGKVVAHGNLHPGQERLRTKLPSIELKEWFGTKHDTEAIRTEIREHKRLSSAWILAMHVRAAACQLSCALPGEQPVAERRLSDIQTALNGSASWKAAASLFEDLIDNKLASRWNFERTLLERRQQLRAELRTVDVWAADNEARITETLGQIKDTIASEAIEFSQPMKIAVEVTTASEVVAVHRIIDG